MLTIKYLYLCCCHLNACCRLYRQGVNKWLLLNANSAICQLQKCISWQEQLNFQWIDDEVRFALDQHAELDLYSANSLKQQSAGRHVAPLGHIILIPSHPIFALSPYNVACLT
jgi:hypothetical protein